MLITIHRSLFIKECLSNNSPGYPVPPTIQAWRILITMHTSTPNSLPTWMLNSFCFQRQSENSTQISHSHSTEALPLSYYRYHLLITKAYAHAIVSTHDNTPSQCTPARTTGYEHQCQTHSVLKGNLKTQLKTLNSHSTEPLPPTY